MKFRITEKQRKLVLAAFLSIYPVWVGRFYKHGHINRVMSRHNWVFFLIMLIVGGFVCYGVVGFWMTTTFEYDAFKESPETVILGAFFLLNIIANPIARYVLQWTPQDFSPLFQSDKHLYFSQAPDTKKRRFPVGWCKERGWLYYGLRPALLHDEYFYPRHIMVCGNYGGGQKSFIMRTIVQALECTNNLVVVVLDDQFSGADFSDIADRNGIVVLDGKDQISRAVYFLGGSYYEQGLLERRLRDTAETPKTEVLLVMDYAITKNAIEKDKRFSQVQSCFRRLICKGKQAGVHIVAIAPAEIFDSEVAIPLRRWFDFLQFHSHNKVTLRYGDQVITRIIESASSFADLFLYEQNGVKWECKQPILTGEQLQNRLDILTQPEELRRSRWRKLFLWWPALIETTNSDWLRVIVYNVLRFLKFMTLFWVPVFFKDRVVGRSREALAFANEFYGLRAAPHKILDDEFVETPWQEDDAERKERLERIHIGAAKVDAGTEY